MSEHWLDSKHPVYEYWLPDWQKNERRAAGGRVVLDELIPFQFEAPDGPSHAGRKQQAVYINFMDQAARALTGHLLRHAPEQDAALDFGGLGKVVRPEGQRFPDFAELVFYNVDGVGNDGSQWNAWWNAVQRRAMHTGHRWVFAEATKTAPRNVQDAIDGSRPYLREFSPISVPNWHYENGRLQFVIARVDQRKPNINAADEMEGQNDQGYLLLVRKGYDGLGSKYQAGGWWLFDAQKTEKSTGQWEATQGEVPFWPFFYERWDGIPSQVPAISRPGSTEVGQVAVAHLNLASAGRFDAWTAASSMTMLLGVSPEQYKVTAEKMKEGSILIPVPADPETGNTPQVYDASSGAVTADVFRTILEGIREEAKELTLTEATSDPGSSGESKKMGFGELKAPRLTDMAQNIEQAQNTAIRFLELRFGIREPSGSVRWDREFDLAELTDDITRMFELERLSGYRSKKVGVEGMVQAAKELRIVQTDSDIQEVREEYEEAVDKKQEADAAMNGLAGDVGIPPFEPPAPPVKRRLDIVRDENGKASGVVENG